MTDEEFEWVMENFAPNLWAALQQELDEDDEGAKLHVCGEHLDGTPCPNQ